MQIRIPEPVPDGLIVIETMRAEADGTIRLWPLHLARLRRDCAAVGFPLDEAALAKAISVVPVGAAHRIRLTVDAAGRIKVCHQLAPPDPGVWKAVISDSRLDSVDPWLRIKTSRREVYDAARAAMPDGCDEAILMNERGEICEGTVTNIFLRRSGLLLTPPLVSGLLPGTLRQSLLDQGQAQEQVLYPRDLCDGTLYCGNALRGLIPLRLSENC